MLTDTQREILAFIASGEGRSGRTLAQITERFGHLTKDELGRDLSGLVTAEYVAESVIYLAETQASDRAMQESDAIVTYVLAPKGEAELP